MALWQDGDVVIEEGKLHYYRTGGDKPSILLLHGFADNGLCWTRLAEVLEKDFDVIMPDARGHGLSVDVAPVKYSLKEMVIDLIKIIQKLGLKTSAIIGHGMGANVALGLASSAPPLVGRLVLEDPEWNDKYFHASKDERTLKADGMRNKIRSWRSQPAQQLIIDFRRSQKINWHKTDYSTWADARLHVSPNSAGYLLNDPISSSDFVAKLVCPTLLLIGDPAAGSLIDANAVEAVRTANPNIKIIQLPEGGHDLRRDKFDPYLQAVKDFLGQN